MFCIDKKYMFIVSLMFFFVIPTLPKKLAADSTPLTAAGSRFSLKPILNNVSCQALKKM